MPAAGPAGSRSSWRGGASTWSGSTSTNRCWRAARDKAPGIRWVTGDLTDVEIVDSDGAICRFDVVALPGNVMIFLTPGSEGDVVMNLTRHLALDGRLVAGFHLGAGRLSLADYDAQAIAADLTLEHRWATWDGEPFTHGDYAVSGPPPRDLDVGGPQSAANELSDHVLAARAGAVGRRSLGRHPR